MPEVKITRPYFPVIGVLFLIFTLTACAHQEEIPVEEIRSRADQSMADLEADEHTPGGPDDDEASMSALRPPPPTNVVRGERPAWVDNPWQVYPASQYLTGVGLAGDRREAENRARAEIAKIFQSDIQAKTRVYQSYLDQTSDSGSDVREEYNIADVTRVSTQKVLSGIRIAEVYEGPEPDNTIYALGVLDRGHTEKILEGRIHSLDEKIGAAIDRANGSEDRLTKVRELESAIRDHALREAYNAELAIVSPGGTGITAPISFSEIKSQLTDQLLRNFFVAVRVAGEHGDEVARALSEGLTEQGFSLVDDTNAAQVLVDGIVEIQPLDRGSTQWQYVRWRTHFDLVDQTTGAIVGSAADSGREGHLSLPQAKDRAVRTINNEVVPKVADEMTAYIFRQQ